ncbi:hypothetical protein N7520_004228 [Penicillium odoratum]|uniref:uncharacterized protein n=1 Tax=Penicillium odoratum TaxID=1167516 RepID=UPI00254783F8|nr:uncharacterized protein N7520_004228 [Penicillium odoratum]KAJ5769669.1 hypothetical protein N7520_004228 [Penicillium odoratum]
MDLNRARGVILLDVNQVQNAITVPVVHQPSSIILNAESGRHTLNNGLITRRGRSNIHFDIARGRVDVLDVKQIIGSIHIPISQEPGTVVANGEARHGLTIRSRVAVLDVNKVKLAVSINIDHLPATVDLHIEHRLSIFKEIRLEVRCTRSDADLHFAGGSVSVLDVDQIQGSIVIIISQRPHSVVLQGEYGGFIGDNVVISVIGWSQLDLDVARACSDGLDIGESR